MTAFIEHVTLNSGHSLRQSRSGVSDAAVAALSETLDGLLQGAVMPVPGNPDYVLNGGHSGYDLWATIWRGPWPSRAPILTTGTALKARSAPRLWRMLHDTATMPCVTGRGAVPPAPWQADRIEAGALDHPEAIVWTGDFARCLAWTWYEYRMRRRA
jgi:hypothetical protein